MWAVDAPLGWRWQPLLIPSFCKKRGLNHRILTIVGLKSTALDHSAILASNFCLFVLLSSFFLIIKLWVLLFEDMLGFNDVFESILSSLIERIFVCFCYLLFLIIKLWVCCLKIFFFGIIFALTQTWTGVSGL